MTRHSTLLACALLSALPAALHAQSVRGRVIDAASSGPIAGASIRLVDAAGAPLAEVTSDSLGRFYLTTRSPGAYRLEARHIAYVAVQTDTLLFAGREMAEVVLRMSTAVIPLEPLSVTARRRDERHYATYAGLYSRREGALPVGPVRVVVKDDPEMRGAITVGDVRRAINAGGCVTVYWNGHMIINREIGGWLSAAMSAYDLEGLEYYRDEYLAPLELRSRSPLNFDAIRCGTLALWARLPDGYSVDMTAPEEPPTLPVTVALAAEIEFEPAASHEAGTIRGRLETPAHTGGSGAVVELVGPRGERFGAVRAGPEGVFLLRAPGPGPYHLRVLHGDLGNATSDVFQLAAGQAGVVILRLGGGR